MKSTDELTHEIQEAGDIISYFEHNREEMQINSFSEYLEQWLAKKQVTRAEVVRWSNLNKAYVYQIFSGKKYPSRDKVIALAFALHLAGGVSGVVSERPSGCAAAVCVQQTHDDFGSQ